MTEFTWENLSRVIRRVTRELSDAEWNRDAERAKILREKLDVLLYKKSIGETHEVNF